ncbi:MAG: hypothetical protein F6K58_13850 [Symploca sp. SIO2E9]|nr:hypothetical protein [Symploca sp. SIO2E9]
MASFGIMNKELLVPQNQGIKSKDITIGGIPLLVYMMPDGEYRWSMRQASKAVGFNLLDKIFTEY